MSEDSDFPVTWQLGFRQAQNNGSAWVFFGTHLNIFFLSFLVKEYLLEDKVFILKHFVDFVDITVVITEKVKEDFTPCNFE